jgi:hypothetical protein
MHRNDVPSTVARYFIVHKNKQIICGGHMKNITLKTNDGTRIAHRYYFHIYSTSITKNH